MIIHKSLIKKIRVVLSIVILLLTSLLLLSSNEWIVNNLQFLSRIQFVNAVLSYELGISLFWLTLTLIFGRVYCSSVCPLGTLQDIFGYIYKWNKRRKGEKNYYHYKPNKDVIQYSILIVFCMAVLLGFLLVVYLIDPFNVFDNILDTFSLNHSDIEKFNFIVITANIGFIIGLISFLVVAYLSYRYGRIICTTICPVGASYSILSRNSIWQFEIDPDYCTSCGKCEAICKSSCIDLSQLKIDMSRCVDCFNCTSVCEDNAIKFTASRKRLSTPLMQKIQDSAPQVANFGEPKGEVSVDCINKNSQHKI